MIEKDINSIEFKTKILKEIENQLEVFTKPESTILIVVAIHKDKFCNTNNRIICKKGMPIGGYCYDAQSDSYYIECAEYFNLGSVPISFMVRVKNSNIWETRIPIPESVLKKYLSSFQKKELRNFKNHFKSDEYYIQFAQIIDVN